MKKSTWENIKGYHVYGIYGGDDASVMQKIGSGMNKLCVVNKSAPLNHPNDLDEGYVKWKHAACGNIRAGRGVGKKGYYDKD